jgi:hypothetical protein
MASSSIDFSLVLSECHGDIVALSARAPLHFTDSEAQRQGLPIGDFLSSYFMVLGFQHSENFKENTVGIPAQLLYLNVQRRWLNRCWI